MDLQVRGKRALVSGARSGIGKAFALCLAKEGCDVTVQGRYRSRTDQVAHEVEAEGVKAFSVYGDLATEPGCNTIAEKTLTSKPGPAWD
jgi:3-oxoacyl-[acyl-carrier protein] reductase